MMLAPPIVAHERPFVARRRKLCAGAVALCCGSAVLIGCESFQSDPKQEARLAWDAQRAALKYEQANADLYRGRVGDAIHLAGEAVALSPTQPAHGELLARAYIAHGDHNAARRVLETLRESHPEFAEAAYLLGTIFERQRDWDGAVDASRHRGCSTHASAWPRARRRRQRAPCPSPRRRSWGACRAPRCPSVRRSRRSA